MEHETPMRKARIALGLTTTEAGQFVHVTRKTWEAWEAGEAAGKPAPARSVELFFAKLDFMMKRQSEHTSSKNDREIVVVLRFDTSLRGDVPVDVVANDTYLGIEDAGQGQKIIKTLAVDRSGRPYVHRTKFDAARNEHILAFCARNTPLA